MCVISRSTKSVAIAVAAALVFGCGADDEAGGTGGAGSGGGATGPGSSVQPVSGLWDYMDGGIFENSCGTDSVYTDPDTIFQLTSDDSGSFTVEQGSEPDFQCTLDGLEFICPSRLSNDTPIPGADAVLRGNVRIEGEFVDARSMSGRQTADITCEGADCAFAPALGLTLPCSYSVDFSATAR